MEEQLNIFEMMYPKFKINKPIRLIEFFAGYGSQALALNYLGIPFEHWKICEWAVKSIQAYKDIHFPNDNEDYSMLNNLSYEKLVDILYNYGISQNYNEPMKLEQIKRLGEKQVRKIFNNIVATHNLVNIQKVKGYSLEIEDTDKYEYIMTYSFPCQDLSLAGKGKGMSDTTTRSGMLWEVERILTECKELGTLPQCLLMENVPQVHSSDNVQDFNKWQLRLEELGYHNYWQDLIATDYGIPQTRKRTFMVSILGEYSYTFPKPIPLKLKLKDLLEDNVDEKYYLSDSMIKYISADNEKWTGNNGEALINKTYASTLNTNEGSRRCDASNYISNDVGENYNLKIKNKTAKGYLEATDGDGIDISSRMKHHRGNVQKDKIQTLTTSGGNESELSKRAKKRNNNLIDADITNGIDYSILDELCRVMKNIYIYIWCSRLQIIDILDYFVKNKKCNYEILVWCKSNPIPVTNNVYLSDLEYCLMFREKGCKLNDGYELKSKWYISPINKKDKELFNHPTIKPLDLVKRHILHSTQPNDIILDCFCGSGTTCLAAKETGRKFIGIEIDPTYYKIAVNRLNGITANGQQSIFTDFDK